MPPTFRRLAAVAAVLTLCLAGTAAAAEYHPSTLLVRFDDGASSAQRSAAHGAVGARVANRFERLDIDVVRLPAGVSPLAARDRYQRIPGVAAVSLNRKIRATSEPNDEYFSDQWGFHNTGQEVYGSSIDGQDDFDIDAPEAWTAAFGDVFPDSGGTLVAVLDTGIDQTHEDLQGKTRACASALAAIGEVVPGHCADDNGHGTHVAGTVTANTDNGDGVAGTAPDAGLAVFKFLNAAGVGFLADEIAGLEWAADQNAKVVSMSFGYEGDPDDSEHKAIRDAAESGALLVAAAGNGGDSSENYPAAYPEVMSVASSSANATLSSFSTCNGDTEIAAPGEDIWSTFVGPFYAALSGTSMATPHVSGAAALVISERGLTAEQARNALKNSSVSLTTDRSGRNDTCPSSLPHLNLADALGASTDGGTTDGGTTDGGTDDGGTTKPGNGKGGGPKSDKKGSGKP